MSRRPSSPRLPAGEIKQTRTKLGPTLLGGRNFLNLGPQREPWLKGLAAARPCRRVPGSSRFDSAFEPHLGATVLSACVCLAWSCEIICFSN